MVPLPFQFPDPLKEAALRADEYQRLPPDEQVRQLFDVVETGRILSQIGDNLEAREKLFAEREAQWQAIQKKWFARHGL